MTSVLVIGGGAREHAIAWKLSESNEVKAVYVAPGNAGTSSPGDGKICNVDVNVKDFTAVCDWCTAQSVTLVVVGPEDPLANGIADKLKEKGIACFGPSAKAAEIEASKAYAKDFMVRHNVPTARYKTFTSPEDAIQYINSDELGEKIVVKASGLAAGKGVVVAETKTEAVDAVKLIMEDKKHGSAGDTIVVEDYLEGDEVSVLAFTDGESVSMMPPAQDHKRLEDGDKGPNTGGMGAICPYPKLTANDLRKIKTDILEKTVQGLKDEGRKYVGVLYAGLMLTKDGPQVLEFNCRMGDPETQSILPLMKTDLLSVLNACVNGELDKLTVEFEKEMSAVGVVLASGGYPGVYKKGINISGVENAINAATMVFHAGTSRNEGSKVVTSGGRVLTVVAMHQQLATAVSMATKAAGLVQFEGAIYRKDIGYKVVSRETSAISSSPSTKSPSSLPRQDITSKPEMPCSQGTIQSIKTPEKSESETSAKDSTPSSKSNTPSSKSSTPPVKSSTPLVGSCTPPVKSSTPISESCTPPAKTSIPLAESRTTPVKSSTPQAESSTPPAKPSTPLSESSTTPDKSSTPLAESRTTPVKPSAPLAESSTPPAKPSTPVAESVKSSSGTLAKSPSPPSIKSVSPSSDVNGLSYKDAGVNIDAGNDLVKAIGPLAKSTVRPGCTSSIGMFGATFDLAAAGFKDPILVSGTDGVGTKLKIAHKVGCHTRIGIDLVAMCVNDILAHGAEPLFFLDYFATGQLSVDVARDVIAGIADGCKQAGCALVGGETAEMPGMYGGGEYDIAGFAVGAVERGQLMPRMQDITAGDVLVGVASSGIHSNGFSLVRKIIERKVLHYDMPSPLKTGKTLGEDLLTPTKIYVKSVLPLLQGGTVKAYAHITGGGLTENIPRVLPENLAAVLEAKSWSVPPIFGWISETGRIPCSEMSRTFNCGIGAVLVVAPQHSTEIVDALKKAGESASVIGSLKQHKPGTSRVRVDHLEDALVQCWRQVPGVARRKRVGVLISGSGTNLQALIDHTKDPINSSAAEIVLVLSNKSGVVGLERAQRAGIQTKVINHKDYGSREEFDEALHRGLTAAGVEIVCLAGFMRILSGGFVKKWRGRMLNVHPSLLPSFKGHDAHTQVIRSGVRISGCSVHFVEEEVDAGAILVQESVPVYPIDTESTLSERVKRIEHKAFPMALEMVATGQATLASDGRLEWNW